LPKRVCANMRLVLCGMRGLVRVCETCTYKIQIDKHMRSKKNHPTMF
jgi:hypothetical protein